MKKMMLILVVLSFGISFAQSNTGLIIGTAVRIRSESNVKAKEISKVYGLREVTIVEESNQWDDLGKNEMCARYKWVKVKWHPDSTGWVYGKYCFTDQHGSGLQTTKTNFDLNGSSYQVQIYENYEYPVGDEEGLTGCNNTWRVYFHEEKTNHYYSISDAFSKADQGETNLVFYSNEGMGESITNIQVNGEKINMHVSIGYQEGSSEADYVIQRFNGEFKVTAYKKGEVKY